MTQGRRYLTTPIYYPSGEPHIGHLKVYSVGDAVAHFHRRTGRRVLHPMGYDAFGLPAEQFAVQTGQHPRTTTEDNIAIMPSNTERDNSSAHNHKITSYSHNVRVSV